MRAGNAFLVLCFIVGGLLAAPCTAEAGDAYGRIDGSVASMPRAGRISDVVSFISALTPDPRERARGAFVWVARNIAYDADAYFRGTRAQVDAEGTFAAGKSVCQGYSALLARILGDLRLDAVLITGYAKGYSYKPGDHFGATNHAWNAVRLEGRWCLLDSTWASGYVDGARYVASFSDAWFDMDPRLFAMNHYPQDARWLILDQPPTLSQYEQAPYVKSYELEELAESQLSVDGQLALLAAAPLPPELAWEVKRMSRAGVGGDLLTEIAGTMRARWPLPQYTTFYAESFLLMGGDPGVLALYMKADSMPKFYRYDELKGVRLLEYPRDARLRAGGTYRFRAVFPGIREAAVISGGKFTILPRDGESFVGEAVAAPGPVKLSARFSHEGNASYWTVAQWDASP